MLQGLMHSSFEAYRLQIVQLIDILLIFSREVDRSDSEIPAVEGILEWAGEQR